MGPEEGEEHLDTIRAFANTELIRHPSRPLSELAEASLMRAIHMSAKKRGITFAQIGVPVA